MSKTKTASNSEAKKAYYTPEMARFYSLSGGADEMLAWFTTDCVGTNCAVILAGTHVMIRTHYHDGPVSEVMLTLAECRELAAAVTAGINRFSAGAR